MTPTLRSALLLLAALPLFQGCSVDLLDRKMREGVIEYELTFPGYDPNGLMAGMLPQRTTVAFTEEMQVAEVSAGMGVFRTAMVSDSKARSLDYHMSLMSKKIRAELNQRDLQLFNEEGEAFTIIHTEEVDTIAGMPCRKAIALFDRMDLPEVELYYTDRIEVKDPNWFGPFRSLPGMLLRYEVVQYGMRVRLEATSVTPGPVEAERFMVRGNYEQVSPEVLHHELGAVFSTFSM